MTGSASGLANIPAKIGGVIDTPGPTPYDANSSKIRTVPQTSSILQPDTSRAPAVALAVLCGLAGICVAAALIAWTKTEPQAGGQARSAELARLEAEMLRDAAMRAPSTGSLPTALPSPSFSTPVLPAPSAPVPTMPQPAAFPAPLPAAPLRPATAAKPSPSRPALPLDKQLKNPQAMESVMAARAMRDQGDMQAAIEALKSADLREPNHPEILGEMALTYEEMGIATRAEVLWRQIYTMGEGTAGGYHTLAASKIGSGRASTAGNAAPESPVTLGPCRLSREPLAQQGERVSVRVPVLVKPGTTIDPAKLVLHVTFYESVNDGERVEAVPQERTTQTWATLPLDWRDASGEAVDVTCDIFRQRQGARGTRSFHGHAVKLFYQDRLAGEQAQPESLRDGAPKSAAPAGLDNALFPK